jgi:parvulin-like peptidyl-prolyl isomerase
VASRRTAARLTAFGLAAALVLSACGDAFHPAAATVNGARITDAQLEDAIPVFRLLGALQSVGCGTPAPSERPLAACARLVLTQLIQQRVVLPFGQSHHVSVSDSELDRLLGPIRNDPRVVQARQTGVTFERLRGYVRSLVLFGRTQLVVAREQVPDSELRALYDQQKLSFTSVHVAHIVVGSQAEAAKLAARATPENFAHLAKRFSTEVTTKDNGGDLGTFPAPRNLEIAQAALQVAPGEIAGPVQTQSGWELIHLIAVKVTPFEQVRDQLLAQVARQAFSDWLRGELRRADVEVNPRYGRFDPGSDEVVPVCSTATAPPAGACARHSPSAP